MEANRSALEDYAHVIVADHESVSPPELSTPNTAQTTRLLPDIATLPPAEVYGAQTTPSTGLSQAEAVKRLQHYGRNVIQEQKGKPLVLKLLANFTHLMAIFYGVMVWWHYGLCRRHAGARDRHLDGQLD